MIQSQCDKVDRTGRVLGEFGWHEILSDRVCICLARIHANRIDLAQSRVQSSGNGRTEPIAPTPAWTTVERAQSNLPLGAVDLIGRAATLRDSRDLLSAYRIVTLTSPGGIGKTRVKL